MESNVSTTTQPPGRQLLCESLNTTPELCDIARQVALHLENSSSLNVTWENMEPKIAEVFRVKWMQEFDNLVNGVLKIAAPKVKEIVAGIEGATIIKPKKGDPTAGILLINEAMLKTRQDEFHIVLPLPISEQAYNRIIRRIQELLPTLQYNAYTPEDTKLLLQSNADREITKELAFMPDHVYINFEAVRYRTSPPLRLFLMIPVFIFQATEEEHID